MHVVLLSGRLSCVRTPLTSSDVHIRLTSLHNFLTRHASYAATGQLPITPMEITFLVGQWHWSDDRSVAQFLWCVHRKDGSAECGRVTVSPKMHENVAQQTNSMKKVNFEG